MNGMDNNTGADADRSSHCIFFNSTSGQSWTKHDGWLTDRPLGEWHGVTVNAVGRVVRLELVDNNITGVIPPELGQLHFLAELLLTKNTLSGPIPPEFGELQALKILGLCDNGLQGRIPMELGKLQALETLDLSDNCFEGEISPEFSKLQALKILDLSFTGSKVKICSLLTTKYTGLIPPEFGELHVLTELLLTSNRLSELGKLQALETLDLSENRLEGVFPRQLSQLRSLAHLNVSGNNLTGCRPLPNDLDNMLGWLLKVSHGGTAWADGNPWVEPPEVVMQDGLPAVTKYFGALFAEGSTVQRTNVKVVIVGQDGAGKTSLLQCIREKRPAPTDGPKDSTVQIDIEDVEINGVGVRFYDCAGQVAYTSLLQMFLTRRALVMVVCDAGAFELRDSSLSDDVQLDQDVRRIDALRVCDWLRFLSFRIPDSGVILVATKCDLAAGMAPDIAARFETASNLWLKTWAEGGMKAVRIEAGASLTSCCFTEGLGREEGTSRFVRGLRYLRHLWKFGWVLEDLESKPWSCDWCENKNDEPPPSLLHRIIFKPDGNELRGAEMALPRSWDIALRVLDALRGGRDPSVVVDSYLKDTLGSREEHGEVVEVTTKEYTGITARELSNEWARVVDAMTRNGVMVANADHALEGALSIREFEGTLVRHEAYIFLDVTWLATILKPLLNHKDDNKFDGTVSLGDMGDSFITLKDKDDIKSWGRLKKHGILEPNLARVIWPRLSDYVLPTLDKLGLIFPFEGDPAGGLVVLLRLPLERPKTVGNDLDNFREGHKEILAARWAFFMGVPPEAIEKVLTRFCSIGAVQTFWRFGALVHCDLGHEEVKGGRMLLAEYAPDDDEKVLDIKVYGDVCTSAPWVVLSYGLSVVQTMCEEFPGLRWEASLGCPQPGHGDENIQINSKVTRQGQSVLGDATCPRCRQETGGLGAVAVKLLNRVNIHEGKDTLFKEVNEKFMGLQACSAELRSEDRLQKCAVEINDGFRTTQAEILRQMGETKNIVAEDFRKIDLLVNMVMAQRAEQIDVPRRACVLPSWEFKLQQGLSDEEQKPEVWKDLLDKWRRGNYTPKKGVCTKTTYLFLVCARTGQLVPCGHKGQGYEIKRVREWVRGAVGLTTLALNVVSAMLGGIVITNLPGSIVGALAEVVINTGVDQSASVIEHASEVVCDNGLDLGLGHQVRDLDRDVYNSLREFIFDIEGKELSKRREVIKEAHRKRAPHRNNPEFVFFKEVMVKVQEKSGDAAVEWVLK